MIHCFPSDVADMSQRPAWFFEQVLQVVSSMHCLLCSLTIINLCISVPFLYLKDFFLLPMTRTFRNFSSDSANDMPWRRCTYTQMNPSCFWSNPYGILAISCVISSDIFAVHSPLMNYPTKQPNARGRRWPSTLLAIERKSHDLPRSQRRLIWTLTSFMHWATTST